MIAIDTETYYDNLGCSVKDLGPEAYSREPKAEVYLVSIHGEGLDYVGPPSLAPWEQLDGREWCAYNAQFDKHMINRLIREGSNPGALPCAPIVDVAAIPAYCQVGRSLDVASRYMLGKVHSKRMRTTMAGKRYQDLKPEVQQAMQDYALEDARLCHDIWEQHRHRLPSEEWELSELTTEAADSGIWIDTETLNAGHAKLLDLREQFISRIPWAGGELQGACSQGSFRKQVKEDRIPDLPPTTSKSDAAWNAWYEKYSPQYPYIKAFKQLGRLNKHFATLDTIKRRVGPDNLLVYGMKYCGTSVTKRWSGGNNEAKAYRQKDTSLNMQNLTRAEYFDVPIRPLFGPRPDHDFIVADLSNIEPRCLGYMIGDQAFLDAMAAGMDPYESHARASMGYSDPRPLKEVDNDMRQLAKVRVLSLPYGTGWKGFQMAMDLWTGTRMTESQAKSAVYSFRDQNPRVTGFWQALQDIFDGSLGEDAEIELPTGSVMHYFDVRRESFPKFGKPGVGTRCYVERGDNARVEFWGAKLTENFIQALARDVFAWKLLALRKAGLRIKWHVHDEVILEVHKSQSKDALETVRQIMSTEDPRLPGLPLAVDAHLATHYDK